MKIGRQPHTIRSIGEIFGCSFCWPKMPHGPEPEPLKMSRQTGRLEVAKPGFADLCGTRCEGMNKCSFVVSKGLGGCDELNNQPTAYRTDLLDFFQGLEHCFQCEILSDALP
jgi:hypothetical protein